MTPARPSLHARRDARGAVWWVLAVSAVMVMIAGTGQGLIGLMRTGRQDKYTTYPSPVCRGLSLGAASSCFLVLTVSNQWTQPRQLEAGASPVVLLLAILPG